MKAAVVAAAVVAGCLDTGTGVGPVAEDSSATYLCVGMEKSARFGECAGCASDAKGMSELLSGKFGYSGTTLISEEATKAKVMEMLKRGVEATAGNQLFIFCYSGHGGQEYLGGNEPEGADSPDEYLCLYDQHMLDDEIWDVLSRCKGRVFMYFDACHSATMYRSVAYDLRPRGARGEALAAPMVKSHGFRMDIAKYVAGGAMGSSGALPSMLCWSGCRESEYSYGGSGGGVMTSALLGSWRKGLSYGALFDSMSKKVRSLQPSQHPVQTYMGIGFETSMEAFR